MIREITSLRFTTIAPWTETEKRTNTKNIMPTEDNFSDIGLLFHIINPQILAYTRKKNSAQLFGTAVLPSRVTWDYFSFSISLLTVHRPLVQASLVSLGSAQFLPQCTVTAAESKLIACYSSLLWSSSEAFKLELSLPDLLKGSKFPFFLQKKEKIHFLHQTSNVPVNKRLFFSSPLISCSISSLHIFPLSVSKIPSLL